MPGIEKYIRIQNLRSGQRDGKETWHTIPNCDRVPVWDLGAVHSLDQADRQSAKRHVFHIAHVEGVVRGSRVTYLGQRFAVIEVSESNKLLGLELQCEPDARGG